METFYFRHNKLSQKPILLKKVTIYYYELTVVLKGELLYKIGNKSVLVKAGDCLYLKPGMVRQRVNDNQAEYLSFNFYDSRAFNLPTHFNNALSTEIKILLTVCDEIYLKHFDWSDKIGKALELIFALLEGRYASLDENPIIVSIKRFIKNNLKEKLTLTEIAKHVGYSACHCDTIFKKETGNSIINYLIEERIDEAKRLIEEGSSSLKTVADSSGFLDYNYFSRIFKKVTGKTPTEFKSICKRTTTYY